ncbi:MAG: phage major capsid protein [Aquidulcibacter sp.]
MRDVSLRDLATVEKRHEFRGGARLYAEPVLPGDHDETPMDLVDKYFYHTERSAFVHGDGHCMPLGFLAVKNADEKSRSENEIGYITTGVNGAFSVNPVDRLIDLTYTIKTNYRSGCCFLLSHDALLEVKRMKDSTGQYIWQPSMSTGDPDTILGFPAYVSGDMPLIEAGSFSVAFGDFSKLYRIIDGPVEVEKKKRIHSTMFHAEKNVDGRVVDYDAVKLLKFSASL